MKEELNIAAILKEKPKGTKLWSPLTGECKLGVVNNDEAWKFSIEVFSKDNNRVTFTKNGKYNKNGDVCLFPSKEMQDWSKFAWKKGDVLEHEEKFTLWVLYAKTDNKFNAYIETKLLLSNFKYIHQLQHLLFGLGLPMDLKV